MIWMDEHRDSKPAHPKGEEYGKIFKRSLENPEEFWGELAEGVSWSRRWTKVLDNSDEPFTRWFVGGEINACYNAVDRHVANGKGEKVAVIYDSPMTGVVKRITYAELLDSVSKMAGVLSGLGVRKGERVFIYMPVIPEALIAMLATARLGAVHCVSFGGFAAGELSSRITHTEPKVVVASTAGLQPKSIIRYKDILEEAFELTPHKSFRCVMVRRPNVWDCPLDPDRYVDWEEAISKAEPHPCVPVEANEPLYILHTSGTTGQPKGVQRPAGGHVVALNWTMKAVYGLEGDDVLWAASDFGWVVGHSLMTYGPLIAGLTSVMYEGKPVQTPDAGQFFRIVSSYRVKSLAAALTVFRAIKSEDPKGEFAKKYDLSCLKYIYTGGENCDPETMDWTARTFGVPVLNHFWQTETGHPVTTTAIGLGHTLRPPKLTTIGLPFPGSDVRILRDDGSDADCNEMGNVVIKLPLPPGNFATLYKAPERFEQLYFSTFPGFYDTMDVGYYDEHGYFYMTSRKDDVINCAGHRLSTSAVEEIVLSHPHVSDATVIGVPDDLKTEVPLCLFVQEKDSTMNEVLIKNDLIRMVREVLGPVASFKTAVAVNALPRTRSGKTCKKSMADLARNQAVKISGTVEDPSVYKEIKRALQRVGYAVMAPDPVSC